MYKNNTPTPSNCRHLSKRAGANRTTNKCDKPGDQKGDGKENIYIKIIFDNATSL